MNVLFIGNSYTYYNDMPTLFEGLANSNGKKITVCSVTKGGRKLAAYTDAADPITLQLDTLLAERKFDVCFIQEQSVLPASDYDEFFGGLNCVIGKLKDRAEQLILYATWGRKQGHKVLTERNWTTESMANLLSTAYQKAAMDCGARVSPVGMNFLKVSQRHPEIELYDADLTHPSYQGSCLAALTHYYTLFGEFPGDTTILSLTMAELSAFQKAICS